MVQNRGWLVLWLPALLWMGTLVGCGGSGLLPVAGTVTLDGAPVAEAAVSFTGPNGQVRSATTDVSGNFSLEAVPGTNQVAVAKTNTTLDQATVNAAARQEEGKEGASEEMGQEMPDIVVTDSDIEWITPLKYANVRTSDLTVEVSKGMDPAKLDLTSQ